ncbi:glycosyl hydrolase, BNR repeat-containing protein, partial [mine drainage metagenome]
PGVYYAGTPEGGIWKTTSAGVTWFPIFDQIKGVDTIGAVQVVPSDPNIVYAGTGDPTVIHPFLGSLGDGMWKSTNAGKTWQHIGLEDTVMIDSILVDPANPNVVIVSALGNATHTVAVSTAPRMAAGPGPTSSSPPVITARAKCVRQRRSQHHAG